jgi:autotransporter adhesin
MDRVGEGTGALIAENNAVLRKDMNAIAAGTSALAGLPQSFIPGRGMMGAAVGGKGDEVAFAMGLSKAFDSAAVPVVRAGAAIDARRGTVSYNASVGFHF